MRLSKEIINKIIDRKKYLVIELEQILLLRAGPVPQKRRPCRLLTMETVVQTFSQCGREYSCVNYTEKKKIISSPSPDVSFFVSTSESTVEQIQRTAQST